MAKPYDPKSIEKKWQKYWEKEGLHKAEDFSDKPKAYVLDMFPYPSGLGLHVGHPIGYIATDVLSRYLRMNGKNVLHPMGWDAFGLPAENYAIKNKVHPRVAVEENIKRFKEQLALFGFSYDWSREINTTDPKYYKWTQWIFLQLFKAGLAYEDNIPINFCLDCKTGLANEEVRDGKCERCGHVVEKRRMRQWVLKITDYADRLLEDLDDLDWTPQLKEMQRNWIGRSEGAEVTFKIRNTNSLAGTDPAKHVQSVAEQTQNNAEGEPNEDRKAMIIHGFEGKPEEGWKPWLKAHLKELGYEVSVPALPNAASPNFKETMQFLRDAIETYGEHDMLIGHSLGALFALKLAEEKRFGNIVLVAPAVGELPFDDYREEWGGSDVDSVQKIIEENPPRMEHVDAIRKTVLFGDEDKWIPKKLIKMFDSSWQVKVLPGRDHMSELKELPEILRALDLMSHDPGSMIHDLLVYTTRPDTLFGATYVVLAPEHSLLEIGKLEIGNLDEVRAYIEKSLNKSDLERQENKEKTGVRLKGVFAINPMNGEELPVFVADYVLMQYGTGAIMAVPAHDERDFEFATKFKLPIVQVISSDGKTGGEVSSAMSGDGILVNSGDFTGMKAEEARKKITANLAEKGAGTSKVNYKLRDWIFSRQRYWGEPIPIIHCKDCGVVPVPEEELPLLLPEVESYEPTGTGESPLAAIDEWVNVKCPKCAGPARRETNTMPQWAGSCWYYLRYIDPDNEDALVDPKKEKYWMPIDLYLGGAEHAVLHLLYARFWHKVLFDGGHVSTSEPFLKLFNQGMILGEDHQKMSKSRGNVVSPDEVIEQYGADSFRLYEMFMGPLEQEKPWDTQGMIGTFRFLRKVYSIMQNVEEGIDDEDPIRLPQRVMQAKLVAKVSKDIDGFDMNTAISAMMEYLNERLVRGPLSRKEAEIFVLLLAPFAPHLTEEIWQEVLEKEGSVHRATWPKRDAEGEKLAGAIVVIRVQVNGKRRGIVNVQKGSSKAKVIEVARALGNVKRAIGDSDIKKTIFVQDIVVNFIVG